MGFITTILFTVILSTTIEGQETPSYYHADCDTTVDIITEFRDALHEFTIDTFKVSTEINNFHTMYSPYSIWMTLSAIAEGADRQTQQHIFKILRLPSDPCRRRAYYRLASTLIQNDDAQTHHRRTLVVDEGVKIDPEWHNYVSKLSLIDVATAPIRSNPEAAVKQIRDTISAELPKLNLSGNSVLLDTMEFNEMLKASFPDAIVERAPFYDAMGQQVGTIDVMRMRKKVRMAYVKSINTKMIELPFGTNSKYTMVILNVINDTDMRSSVKMSSGGTIMEAFDGLRESAIPLDVVIPRLNLTSETDVRVMLEVMGLKNLWNDEDVTRSISEPAALPSSYMQRTSLKVDNGGMNLSSLPPSPPLDAETGLDAKVGREFVGDRPFLLGIFERETYTCMLAVAFAQPTYGL